MVKQIIMYSLIAASIFVGMALLPSATNSMECQTVEQLKLEQTPRTRVVREFSGHKLTGLLSVMKQYGYESPVQPDHVVMLASVTERAAFVTYVDGCYAGYIMHTSVEFAMKLVREAIGRTS